MSKGSTSSRSNNRRFVPIEEGPAHFLTDRMRNVLSQVRPSVVMEIQATVNQWKSSSKLFQIFMFFKDNPHPEGVLAYELAIGLFTEIARLNLRWAILLVHAWIAALNSWNKNKSIVVHSVDGRYQVIQNKLQYGPVEAKKEAIGNGLEEATTRAEDKFAIPAKKRKRLAEELEEEETIRLSNQGVNQ